MSKAFRQFPQDEDKTLWGDLATTHNPSPPTRADETRGLLALTQRSMTGMRQNEDWNATEWEYDSNTAEHDEHMTEYDSRGAPYVLNSRSEENFIRNTSILGKFLEYGGIRTYSISPPAGTLSPVTAGRIKCNRRNTL